MSAGAGSSGACTSPRQFSTTVQEWIAANGEEESGDSDSSRSELGSPGTVCSMKDTAFEDLTIRLGGNICKAVLCVWE